MWLLLSICHIYLYLFNLQYMSVGPVVHKSKWSFVFMHNWTTYGLFEAAGLETGGIRRCEYFPWIENVDVVC